MRNAFMRTFPLVYFITGCILSIPIVVPFWILKYLIAFGYMAYCHLNKLFIIFFKQWYKGRVWDEDRPIIIEIENRMNKVITEWFQVKYENSYRFILEED